MPFFQLKKAFYCSCTVHWIIWIFNLLKAFFERTLYLNILFGWQYRHIMVENVSLKQKNRETAQQKGTRHDFAIILYIYIFVKR